LDVGKLVGDAHPVGRLARDRLMKIAIASIGRFHVLDLARELDRNGFEVSFHSYVPRKRAERFGLPSHCHRGLLPIVAPLVVWQQYAQNILPAAQERAMAYALDAAVTATLAPCDVFICMSGMYLEAARYAKKRFGAQVWLERGSRHIVSQREIMKELGAAKGPSSFIVQRELAGYELADRIVVPSRHVVQSFEEQNPALVPKLFVNPYGVDLAQFPAQPARSLDGPPTVLYVGGWSLRKGVDVLVDAVRRLDGARLLHVGALIDQPFPGDDPRFVHVEPVPQWRLKEYYAQADVFALASREEGLALVQAQALASGLALVCTERTGGADLSLSPTLGERIFVTPMNDGAAFAGALEAAIRWVRHDALDSQPASDRSLLSWNAYGARYASELRRRGSSNLSTRGAYA
jgi:glycosyltransferase involved in cell wall biosynthesis